MASTKHDSQADLPATTASTSTDQPVRSLDATQQHAAGTTSTSANPAGTIVLSTTSESELQPDNHHDSILNLELDTVAHDDDTDSAYSGAGTSMASTSLASSVMHYEYANGRRYHGYRSGAYVLPNDDEEQDRLDFIHHIFLMILDGKLYDAPLPHPPRRALDVGTGTGIWCIDFGDANPGSEVIGTDLSPIQPSWVPPNVKFYIDDCEADWVYPPSEHFDYIHVRELSGSIADWKRLTEQAYSNLQPDGWLEYQEPMAAFETDDDSLVHTPDLDEWQKSINLVADGFGKKITIAHTLKQLMIDAGFADVHEKIVKVPIGPWPKDPKMKEIGRYHREQVAQGVPAYTLGFFGKVKGWSEDECKVAAAKVVRDMRNPKLHSYVRYYFVYGRRPA